MQIVDYTLIKAKKNHYIFHIFLDSEAFAGNCMSIRTFIFCDICNPQALRTIEFRRAARKGVRLGRRISDGRSWYEGSLENAMDKGGWITTPNGLHLCPNCQSLH